MEKLKASVIDLQLAKSRDVVLELLNSAAVATGLQEGNALLIQHLSLGLKDVLVEWATESEYNIVAGDRDDEIFAGVAQDVSVATSVLMAYLNNSEEIAKLVRDNETLIPPGVTIH